MNNSARTEFYNEEGVNLPEEQVDNWEKVTGPDQLGVFWRTVDRFWPWGRGRAMRRPAPWRLPPAQAGPPGPGPSGSSTSGHGCRVS